MGMLPSITSRRDFVAANQHGKKFVTPRFILLANQRSHDHPVAPAPRIGITVTKKIGNAVVRNRIKRQLREAIRATFTPHSQERYDYVIIARHGLIKAPYATITRDMEFAFSRIHAMKNAPSAHNPKQGAQQPPRKPEDS